MTCPTCGETFERNRMGRPKTYCSRRCQVARPCQKRGCRKPVWSEDVCWFHHRKHLESEPSWNMGDRLTDLLTVDGGWWTLDALSDRFNAHPDSILRAARLLEKRGVLVRRQLALASRHGGYDHRVEWRAV